MQLRNTSLNIDVYIREKSLESGVSKNMASKVPILIDNRRSATPVSSPVRPRFTAMKEPKSILKHPKAKRKRPYVPVLTTMTQGAISGRNRTCFGNYFKEMAEWRTGLSMTPAAKKMFDCVLTDFLREFLSVATRDELMVPTGYGKKKSRTLTIMALEYAVHDLFGMKRGREMVGYINHRSEHLDSAWQSEAEEEKEKELVSDK